jgi:tetratricopeptide (TPR) repeat protein
MTVAEAVLPHIGMYRAARWVAERHYVDGLHGPGAKEHVLARIYELAGDTRRAEELYKKAVELRFDFADYHIFLGNFLARRKRMHEAIGALESARPFVQDQGTLGFIEANISKLQAYDQK